MLIQLERTLDKAHRKLALVVAENDAESKEFCRDLDQLAFCLGQCMLQLD